MDMTHPDPGRDRPDDRPHRATDRAENLPNHPNWTSKDRHGSA